ncbi:MAG: hypothetical protein NZT92_22405 [Abditibacteriales bacterium]|nr:hypothetical protein [Abditibacteriales bacterium]
MAVITQIPHHSAHKSPSGVKVKDEFVVNCNGEQHKVIVTEKGRLLLPHHPDIEGELAFAGLGGNTPECLRLLEDLRSHQSPHISLVGQDGDFIRHVWQKQSQRRQRRAVTDPLLRQTMRERAEERFVGIVQSCIKQCRYEGGDNTNTKHEIRVHIVKNTPPRFARFVEKKECNECVLVTELHLPLRWLTIWRRGLAVIKGCFVLEVLWDGGDELVVLAVQQRIGFSVQLRQARFDIKRGSLTWFDPIPPNGQLYLPL